MFAKYSEKANKLEVFVIVPVPILRTEFMEARSSVQTCIVCEVNADERQFHIKLG